MNTATAALAADFDHALRVTGRHTLACRTCGDTFGATITGSDRQATIADLATGATPRECPGR
jgi:hypothetical protein